MLRCYWQPTSSSRSCSYRGPRNYLHLFLCYIGDSTLHVMCNGMTAVWLVVTRVSSYCVACVQTVRKGCSTTRGHWFGSGLPVEERQTCCTRRGVKTAHFSLNALLASSIIRSCDATVLHTPLPHSRFGDLRVNVIWLLRTIIRLFRHSNIYVNTKREPAFPRRERYCPKFQRSPVQDSDWVPHTLADIPVVVLISSTSMPKKYFNL